MARHVDFDADWERFARSQSGPIIKVRGVEHQLPTSPPIVVVVTRWKLVTGQPVTIDQILDVLRLLFGDTVDQWVDAGLERQQLLHLLLAVASSWDPEPEEDAEGEAQPPGTGAPTEPSSPTSSTAGPTS